MEQFGKYQLIKRIGAGGMAEVFLARSAVAQGLAKIVVIKKIHPAFARSKHFLSMFVDEAKIALSLNHPNIVQVFDFGQVSSDCFLAMEYVEGLDVLRLMQAAQAAGRRVPYGLAAYLVQQMAKGLDYAHRKPDEYGEPLGIVHRDVSPQNVLVSWDGAVKIVDFGIARARDVHEDEGVVKGKFAYMSPEQAAGRGVDRRSDVFSAGIVLYELATGRPLFSGMRGAAALEAVKSGAIPRPRTVDPELPGDLEEIILKTLAYHPEDRYQTARDLQQALLRVFYRIAIDGDSAMDSGALAAFASQVVPPETRRPPTQKLDGEGTVVPQAPHSTSRGRSPRREFAPPADSDRVGTYVSAGHMPASTPSAGTPASRPGDSEAPDRREHVSELRERKHVVVVEGRVEQAAEASTGGGGAPGPDRRGVDPLKDYLQVAEDIAYKHEAYCDRLEERGFTYIIGLPVSTEDDSGRAVKLALALCDAVDAISRDQAATPLTLSVGVQRGLALVTRGSKDQFEYQLVGATQTIARSLAEAARPGEILVGGGVYRSAKSDWSFEDRPEIDIPEDNETSPGGASLLDEDGDGKSVRRAKAYRLRGHKDRMERLRDSGALGAQLVGRELELRALRDLYRQTVMSRRAHNALVVGEAGVGKRTLVAEFLRGISGTDHTVLRARARSSMQDTPYAVTADLARDVLGLAEHADPKEIRQRLEMSAELLWPSTQQTADVRQMIETFGMLLGITFDGAGAVPRLPAQHDIEPAEWRHRVARALRKLQDRLAHDRPLVVVIEDFHWADSQSFELFYAMVRERAAQPVFGIGTFRPDERIGDIRSLAQLVIELGDLGLREREELVLARFGGDEDARELAREIISKAGGNPMFIREVLDALIERGVVTEDTAKRFGRPADAPPLLRWVKRDAPIQVPTSVEALVGSRLDRLPALEKEAITRASVIGRVFSETDVSALLDRATHDPLERLIDRGLLERVTAGPGGVAMPGLLQFRNEMTLEVAYGILPATERRELHRKAASRIANARGFRRGPDDAQVARHLERAGEPGLAARAYVAAGNYARDVSGAAEALRHYTRALQLLPGPAAAPPPGDADQTPSPAAQEHATWRFEIHTEREGLLRALGRRPAQLREIHAMRRSAETARDDKLLAHAQGRLARFYLEIGRAAAARRALAQALETARRAGDKLAESEALRLEAQLLKQIGKNAEALALCKEALALCSEDRAGLLQRGMILNSLGTVQTHMGSPREAIAAYAEALVIYRRLGVRRMEAATLNNMGIVSSSLGEFEEALAHYKRSLKIDQDLGDRLALGIKLSNIGQTYMDLGDDDKARKYLAKALSLASQLGDAAGSVDAMISLAQVHLKRGEAKPARELLEKGLAEAIKAKSRYQEIRALVYLAFCDVEPGGRPEGALEYARSAARLARDAVIPQGEIYAMSAEALALSKIGKLDEAVARSGEAIALIDGGREVEGVEEILYIYSKLLREVGRSDDAGRLLVRAYNEVQSKARRVRDGGWREKYLQSTPARQIVADHRTLTPGAKQGEPERDPR